MKMHPQRWAALAGVLVLTGSLLTGCAKSSEKLSSEPDTGAANQMPPQARAAQDRAAAEARARSGQQGQAMQQNTPGGTR